MTISTARHLPLLALGLLLACQGGPTEPEEDVLVLVAPGTTSLGTARTAEVILVNQGTRALGPVELFAAPVRDPGGGNVPGTRLRIDPEQIPTLNPGDAVTVALTVELSGTLQPGLYRTVVTARVDGGTSAVLDVDFSIVPPTTEAVALQLHPLPASVRQGDVIGVAADVRDDAGAVLEGAQVAWTLEPPESGFIGANGALVGYRPGPTLVIARAGVAADTASVTIEPRGLTGSFVPVGAGLEQRRFTSDLWVRGEHVYLGTWGFRDDVPGNTLSTWSVADPSSPTFVDSLRVDARTVNDVKVHRSRPLAIITHELSEDARNGVTLLDLSDPASPRPVSRFMTGLEPGIHNTWLDGDYAFLVVDGVGNGLRILDIADPAEPRVVASYWAGDSFLHDVYVRDGLAFLSHWNAGLVILDVGNGIAGGSPESPVEVSRLADLGGQTHNTWYWPDTGYAFVGEEDYGTPGRLHVVDLRDLRTPREVATFAVPGQTPHNFWLDEDRGILYAAWYGEGIRAIDVTGELLGDLTRQGREITGLRYNAGPGTCAGRTATCTWAPQLGDDGLLYLSDRNAGLVVLRPAF